VEPVRWGNLRRLAPFSQEWGFDRGLPVDRYYIESFLRANAADIRGRVLEISEPLYTRKFGRDVASSDVLHVTDGNPAATIVADLASAENVPSDRFDCVILTQTLHLIYEVRPAIRSVHRILRPGGVVLATLPTISQISRYDFEHWGDYWRFTSMSARNLFTEFFPEDRVRVDAHGNVLAATAFLQGVAAGELVPRELDHRDPDYEVLITVRAVKPPIDG
jgi:SAM-dependent methyltransferase